jgi:hypothetical protein
MRLRRILDAGSGGLHALLAPQGRRKPSETLRRTLGVEDRATQDDLWGEKASVPHRWGARSQFLPLSVFWCHLRSSGVGVLHPQTGQSNRGVGGSAQHYGSRAINALLKLAPCEYLCNCGFLWRTPARTNVMHMSSVVGVFAAVSRAVRRLLPLAMLLLVLTVAVDSPAQAQFRRWSPYERETVLIALQQTGEQLESDPGGKTLESVRVFTLDVFEPRDPAPQFLNWFHTTTRDYVVRREVLIEIGQPYDSRLAAETERNLRAFSQLSVVLVVPVKGSAASSVKLLVITKDVWSLRASTQPTFFNGKLAALTLAPSETNIFGTTQSVSAVLGMNANTYSIGGSYYVPRIGQSRIAALVSGSGVFNCATNKLEGATGYFQYGQPVYSSLAKWSWRTAASWSSVISRPSTADSVCSGGRTLPTVYRATPDMIQTQDGTTTVTRREISFPNETRVEQLRGQLMVTRSFNRWNKVNLSSGVELDWRAYSREPVTIGETPNQRVVYIQRPDGSLGARTVIPEQNPGPPDPVEFAAFHSHYLSPDRLPPRDRRISPYLQLRAFSNTYRRLVNYHTLGLQEDVQMGHEVYLRVFPSFRPLSTRDRLGVFASAAYTLPVQDGVFKVLGESSVEAGEQSDAHVRFAMHFATPDIGIGRFIYDAGFVHQPIRFFAGNYYVGGGGVSEYRNGLAGGAGRLRGYRPVADSGPGVVTLNHEFRSRPIRLFSVLAGLALFHDMGSAVQPGLTDVHLRHGVGAGLRLLAPQLDRSVFRVDVGFPLVFPMRDDPAAQVTFLAAFGQAIGTPVSYPPALLIQ